MVSGSSPLGYLRSLRTVVFFIPLMTGLVLGMGGRRFNGAFINPESLTEMRPLMLPEDGQGLVVAVFGVGAYQQMISGRGGAHHCLNPEMRRIIIEQDGDALVVREVAPQNLSTIMGLLGYNAEALEPVARPLAQIDRRPAREMARVLRAPRRRQFVPRPRALAQRDSRGAQAGI